MPSRSARVGVRVVRGRLPGAMVPGRPSLSQYIWPRAVSPKPRPSTTGVVCSEVPLGVPDIMLPWRSMMSKWVVSPS